MFTNQPSKIMSCLSILPDRLPHVLIRYEAWYATLKVLSWSSCDQYSTIIVINSAITSRLYESLRYRPGCILINPAITIQLRSWSRPAITIQMCSWSILLLRINLWSWSSWRSLLKSDCDRVCNQNWTRSWLIFRSLLNHDRELVGGHYQHTHLRTRLRSLKIIWHFCNPYQVFTSYQYDPHQPKSRCDRMAHNNVHSGCKQTWLVTRFE